MTRDTVHTWFRNSGWQIIPALIGIGVMWATQAAAIGTKAEKSEVQALASELHQVHVLLCRNNTRDSACP